MSTVLERMKQKVASESSPEITQIFPKSETKEEKKGVATDNFSPVNNEVQTIVEPKLIKQNNPGVPVMGFTMSVLADELGTVLEKSMHRAGVSSITAESLGILNSLGLTPRGFDRVVDQFTGIEFLVLQNANRMTEIFKALVKALNTSSLDVISFPYLVETKLELPIVYNKDREDFEYATVNTKGMYLTDLEIDSLNYKFITEIQFSGKTEDQEGSIDLLVMKIDREEWKAAPYRI